MNKLLSAGFARLWKNKFFWLGIVLLPGIIVLALSSNYHDMKLGYFQAHLDDFLYGAYMFIGIFTAVFASLFLGTEYSDGTMRNKLIIGHSRVSVYLSSLIVCFISSLIVSLAAILITFAVGIPLFGMPQTPPAAIVLAYLYGSLMIAALSGVFTLLSMLISSKPISAVTCTVGIFILMFVTTAIIQRLQAPEMLTGMYDMSVDGNIIPQEPVPNPYYLRGMTRTIYEFLRDLLPLGIGIQLNQGGLQHPLQSCLLAVFVTAGTTAGGILAFRRKDLK